MHTITMLGMKGGTGRTTLTMALAMAFVAKGRRVLIVDGTEDGTEHGHFEVSITLQQWQELLLEEGLPRDALAIETFNEHEALEDLLTRARRRGIDTALIDTSNRRTERLATCLETADLALVPFPGLPEARSALEGMALPTGHDVPLFGVANALSDPVPTREATIEALGMPLLRTTLPRADLFREMPSRGRLDGLGADIDAQETGLTAALATCEAWAKTLDLAAEIEWALTGLVLTPYHPSERIA